MRHLGVIVGLGVLLGAASSTLAATGTCTVTEARQLIKKPLRDVAPPIPGMVGMQFPVEIDAAMGAISFSRPTNWVEQKFVVFGSSIHGYIDIPNPGPFAGTIDAGGNITIPSLYTDVDTDFCGNGERCGKLPTDLRMSTGLGETVSGEVYPVRGAALDFATGTLTLEGHVVHLNSPGLPGSTSGMRIICTLAPIPAAADLPKAAKLGKPKGKITIGGPAATDGTVPGDTLALTVSFTKGKVGSADLTRDDAWVELKDATGGQAVLLLVRGGRFTAAGKKLRAADTNVDLLVGNDKVAAEPSGTITISQTKKAITLKVDQRGLNLAALTGVVRVGVTIGDQTASAPAKVVPGKKGNKIK